jgi:hypothetical protein
MVNKVKEELLSQLKSKLYGCFSRQVGAIKSEVEQESIIKLNELKEEWSSIDLP